MSARQIPRADGDSPKKAVRPVKAKPTAPVAPAAPATDAASAVSAKAPRTVTFPFRSDFDVSITLPREGMSVKELKKLLYFLLPYAIDWEPTMSPRTVFEVLERELPERVRLTGAPVGSPVKHYAPP